MRKTARTVLSIVILIILAAGLNALLRGLSLPEGLLPLGKLDAAEPAGEITPELPVGTIIPTIITTPGVTPDPNEPQILPTSSPNDTSVLEGAVVFRDGQGPLHGVVGEFISVQAVLTATSTITQSVEVRLLPSFGINAGCAGLDEIEKQAWMPLPPSIDYAIRGISNRFTFYLTAQFRDEIGNLSALVCEFIDIEAEIPTSTPWVTPTP